MPERYVKSFSSEWGEGTLLDALKREAKEYLGRYFTQIEMSGGVQNFTSLNSSNHTATIDVEARNKDIEQPYRYRFEGFQCRDGENALARVDVYHITQKDTQDDMGPGG